MHLRGLCAFPRRTLPCAAQRSHALCGPFICTQVRVDLSQDAQGIQPAQNAFGFCLAQDEQQLVEDSFATHPIQQIESTL